MQQKSRWIAAPDAAPAEFPRSGLVRLSEILSPRGPVPVGRTTWWQGVRDGRYPKPVKLGPRITAWRAEEIQKLLKDGAA